LNVEKSKQLVFLSVIAVIILIVAAVYLYWTTLQFLLPFIILAILMILMFAKFDVLIMLREYERAVVFRFGKLHRVGGPGWFFMIPGIETFEMVDLRVQTLDIEPQDIITKGKIECKVDAVIYMRVGESKENVIKSVIRVEDYRRAAKIFVASTLRDVAGDMSLSELISKVESLNQQLKEKLQSISKDWGVLIDAVEIKDINIPKTVLDAMHDEKAAEQKKLARMEEALAHKAEIEAVKEAAAGLDDRALSYYYIRALEKMSEGKATKIIFPVELSRLADLVAGKIGTAGLKKEAEKLSPEELIIKYKDQLEQAFGKELANNLVKVVKEEAPEAAAAVKKKKAKPKAKKKTKKKK
jgi:regulator of protease activity HflC (stomatin/prohibitin superfamily)